MKRILFLPLAFGVTPVQKVVSMLDDMLVKGKQEKHEEEVQFATFTQWCSDTEKEKTRLISQAADALEQHSASMQKAQADAAQYAQVVAHRSAEVGTWESDAKATREIRAQEKKDYLAAHRDYTESIDALGRAINVLQRQNFDRSQASSAEAMIQLEKVAQMKIPANARRVITAFLAQDPDLNQDDFLSRSAPGANAYEFQSGGVIDLLKNLKTKFVDEIREFEREEVNKKHSAEMILQDLKDQISTANNQIKEASVAKTRREQAGAQAKTAFQETTVTHDEDSKYLSDLQAECRLKSEDFGSRQKVRGEELVALEKAIEVLSSDAVAGNASKHLPTLLEKKKQGITSTPRTPHHSQLVSFLQLLSKTRNGQHIVDNEALQMRVANFLAQRASVVDSHILSLMAQKATEDPFGKVKKMLQDLITRLMEEATEETEHKGWCDAELAANKVTRDQKTEQVEGLQASVDELDANVLKLAQDITDLSAAITELDSAVASATEIRNKERETNEAATADAKEAQVAVSKAITVLREFYNQAATSTALMQRRRSEGPADDAPLTFSTPYTGMQAESGGVVGMLEVIQSDFARLESETSTSETQAEKAYTEFKNDSAEDKAVKTTQKAHLERTKQAKESQRQAAKKDLVGTREELDAALQYYEKLKPSCVNSGVSFEDRTARRQEEIESLKEALRILSGEDIAGVF